MFRIVLVSLLLLSVAQGKTSWAQDPTTTPPSQEQLPQITEKEVRAVQQALFSRGLLAKQPTGVLDGPTREALLAYQKKEGLQETGRIDQPTVDKLGLTFPVTEEDDKSKRKNGVLPKIGYAVKDGANATSKAVGDTAKKVGGATKSGAQKTVDASGEGAKAAGDKSVEGAKTVGHEVQKTSTEVATATVGRSDDSIHKDVRDVLNKDEKTKELVSEVNEGKVTLTSEGPTESDLAGTITIIRKIAGVKSVTLINR